MLVINITPSNFSFSLTYCGNYVDSLRNKFKIPLPNRFFSYKFKTTQWDGNIRFYTQRKDIITFPTGLLKEVTDFFDSVGIRYQINNPYLLPTGKYGLNACHLQGISLRDDQWNCLDLCLSLGRGIIQGDTGSGKTEIMIALTKWFVVNILQDGEKVLFLTHRQVIFDTNYRQRLRLRLGLDVADTFNRGSIRGFSYRGKEIIVAIVQTFLSQIENEKINEFLDLSKIKVIFCDEVHSSEVSEGRSSGGYKTKDELGRDTHVLGRMVKIFKHFEDVYNRFGFSATPFKQIIKRNQLIDDPIHKYNVMKNFGSIIKLEYSSPITIKIHWLDIPYKIKKVTYRESYQQLKWNRTRFQQLRKILNSNSDKQILIFVKYVDHGNHLKNALAAYNDKAEFICGETSRKEKLSVIKQFKNRKLRVLIVNSILYFGVDLPEIDIIVLYHIEKSYINTIQAIGRGKRGNKQELIIYDFYDIDGSFNEKYSKKRHLYYKANNFKEGIPYEKKNNIFIAGVSFYY